MGAVGYLEGIDFLTIKEFAILIRVHPNTVRRAIKRGRINAFRIGEGDQSPFRIPRAEINRISLLDLEKIIDGIVQRKLKE